jgi:endonuclease/exonuclease/phosphatase family metal-dependent hydrolase
VTLSLRLLGWNLGAPPWAGFRISERQYRGKLEHAAAAIRHHRPDLVLLQEVAYKANAEYLAEVLSDSFESLNGRWPDKPVVPYWLYWFVPFALFHFHYRMNKAGLMAFARRGSEWTAVDAATYEPYRASASQFRVFEGDGHLEKGIQRIAMIHTGTGTKLILLNTHLQAQYPGRSRTYDDVRELQIDQLAATLAGEPGEAAVLAAGDFNVCQGSFQSECFNPRDDGLYETLTSSWRELTREARVSCARGCATFLGGRGEPPQWLDYVFARDGYAGPLRVVDVRFVGRDPPPAVSDHLGILIDLEIPAASATVGLSAPTLLSAAAALESPVTRRGALAALGAAAAMGLRRSWMP